MNTKIILCFLVCVLVNSCSSLKEKRSALTTSLPHKWVSNIQQNHPLVGKIYDIENEKEIGFGDLIHQLNQSNVLIGEKHDNPDHQKLEFTLLTNLEHRDRSIVYEMISSEYASRINNLKHPKNAEELKDQLKWRNSGWKWETYGEIIHFGYQNFQSIKPGNLSKQTIQQIYRDGLPVQTKSTRKLQSELSTPLLDILYSSHCELIEKEKLTPLLDIQLARDSYMAKQMIESNAGAILIAGANHVRKDIGVPKHLSEITQTPSYSKVLSVALIEVLQDKQKLVDYDLDKKYDFVVFTPIYKEIDYCKKLRKQFEARSK